MASLTSPRSRALAIGLLYALAACASIGCATASVGGPSRTPRFQHVIVVVFENKEVGDVLGNSDATTFNRLASRCATIANYSGVTHPSLPNYLALISGSTHGIDSDCTDCLVDGRGLPTPFQESKPAATH
jgi:phosphatidylinositol-3-phosphatase